MTDTKRIHFMSDVAGCVGGYECQRCGERTTTMRDMYDHRNGVLSDCTKQRMLGFLGLRRDA